MPARPELASLHDRMPLVLEPGRWPGWLDPKLPEVPGLLEAAALPYATHSVSRAVNNVRNDGPELVRPLYGTAT